MVQFLSNTSLPLFATLFLLAGNACTEKKEATAGPQTVERIERYENGAVSRRVQIIDGKKEGKMTDYYNDGKIMAERWFKTDCRKEIQPFTHPKSEESSFTSGEKQSGGDTIWYETAGCTMLFFRTTKKEGYLRKWSPEGKVIFESKYHLDTLTEIKGVPMPRKSPEQATQ
ncbi:MAG: hypothetical protein IPJ82_23530 [Lewinellaceae bacterium]|nr:hypothetical protein [Lewinellaceae bacterium]